MKQGKIQGLVEKCPHHSFTKWMQVHHFYNGLSAPMRTLIDALAGGAIKWRHIKFLRI